MTELRVYFADGPPEGLGFRTVLVTEPEHTFVHTVKGLLDGIAIGGNPTPTFEDGYRCQAVLDAVDRSLESGTWTEPARIDARAV